MNPNRPHAVSLPSGFRGEGDCGRACVPGRLRNQYGTFIPVDAVFKALGDESRRTVLEALRGGPASVSELAAMLPIARPGVSRHLRVLREVGLVEVRKTAQFRIYSLRSEPLVEIDGWLDRYRSLWQQRFDALHTEVARGKRQRRSKP
jgi:DNA-binding transcriptional ArsR family regulator